MKTSRKFPRRALPGLILILAGLIGLYRGPEISQYVFLPGQADYAALLAGTEEKWDGAFPAVSLHGAAEGVSLSAGAQSVGNVTLYETMGGYFEVYPRQFSAGRPLTRGDGKNAVIVLDDRLAFQLFGDRDPVGLEASIGDQKFEVVGMCARRRGVGDAGEYAAWIPLGANGAPACAVMVLSAGGGAEDSMRTVFENDAAEAFGAGQAFHLGKERSRGTILLRAVLILVGFWILKAWIRLFRRKTAEWIAELREKGKLKYPHQMLGSILGRSAEILIFGAVIIAAAAGLVMWAAQPMTVFPEWVPDNLVSAASIAKRFRELTAAAAAPVRFGTPETAEIRFWSGMIRWGTVLALLGFWRDGMKNKAGPAVAKREDA